MELSAWLKCMKMRSMGGFGDADATVLHFEMDAAVARIRLRPSAP